MKKTAPLTSLDVPTTLQTLVYPNPNEISIFLNCLSRPTDKNAVKRENLSLKFFDFLRENFQPYIWCELEFFIKGNPHFSYFKWELQRIWESGKITGVALFCKVQAKKWEMMQIFPIELFKNEIEFQVVGHPKVWQPVTQSVKDQVDEVLEQL